MSKTEKADYLKDGRHGKLSLQSEMARSLEILWKIPGISHPPDKIDWSLESPPFNFSMATWCFKLYPKRKNAISKSPCITLVRLNSLIPCHTIVCNSIMTFKGDKFRYAHVKLEFDNEERENLFRTFEEKYGEKEEWERCYQNLLSGTLTLRCSLLFEESAEVIEHSEEVIHRLDILNKGKETEKTTGNIFLESSTVLSINIFWYIQDSLLRSRLPIESPQCGFANAIWRFRFIPEETEPGESWSLDTLELSMTRLFSLESCHNILCSYEIKENDYYSGIHYNSHSFNKYVTASVIKYPYSFTGLHFVQDHPLELKFHLFIKDSSEEYTMDKKIECLVKDFKYMFLNGRNSDIMLNVDGKEFPVHQAILRARSEYFDAMLSHEMLEKNRGIVEIPDCDPQAFEQFLFYIYSGDVETLDENNMLGLYYIADKYNIADLKVECCEFIEKSVAKENVCDILQIALNHSDTGLLECATRYFMANVDDILPTIEWQLFMKENPTQANELIIKSVKELKNSKS